MSRSSNFADTKNHEDLVGSRYFFKISSDVRQVRIISAIENKVVSCKVIQSRTARHQVASFRLSHAFDKRRQRFLERRLGAVREDLPKWKANT